LCDAVSVNSIPLNITFVPTSTKLLLVAPVTYDVILPGVVKSMLYDPALAFACVRVTDGYFSSTKYHSNNSFKFLPSHSVWISSDSF
jgi:hypothetical protein